MIDKVMLHTKVPRRDGSILPAPESDSAPALLTVPLIAHHYW